MDTRFGRTHLVKTGKPDGIPLLLFHGCNPTSAYTLLSCDFLMKDFCVCAVDTIGHPAKRAIPRAKHIIDHCPVYLLKGRGHLHSLTDHEKRMIVDLKKA